MLQDLAHILPVLPVDAAPRLVQLLCCQSHGKQCICSTMRACEPTKERPYVRRHQLLDSNEEQGLRTPVEAAMCHLHVPLICTGAAAARVLTAQLAHWRCSQLLPHWMAAGSTDNLFQQLQQLHVLSQTPEASGRNTASRAADACVSMLMLLAKMASLAEQQMLAQLSADAVTASRWASMLDACAGVHAQLEW